MNNVVYLFKWDINEDVTFLNKNRYWMSFNQGMIKHKLNKDINFSILTSKIYRDILSKTLKNDTNTVRFSSSNNNIYGDLNKKLQEDNDIRYMFQEINTTNGSNNNNKKKNSNRELNNLY